MLKNLKRKIIITDDGSSSLQLLNVKESYHSTFGAIQEAEFVYIKNGLNHFFTKSNNLKNTAVLEMGFGTGLNAFLTYLFAKKIKLILIILVLKLIHLVRMKWNNSIIFSN
jgi:tRNA U34 5-methylaminomethyl-2-thiouridine-forming methyltransferase MnmC